MLDIHSAIKELKYVKALHVVSIRNECKELVFIIERGYGGEVEMTAANFTPGGGLQSFTFEANEEASSQCNFSEPLNYLYEPNASLMKLGAFKTLCNRYLIQKLHPNSHIYTSGNLVEGFPGRIFKIQWTSAFKPGQIRKRLSSSKANITVRNFITDVKAIRKQCKLSEGGKDYLFATTGMDGQPIIINGHRL
jgi:hypothetical protein